MRFGNLNLLGLFVLLAAAFSLQIGNDLSLSMQWSLATLATEAQEFADFNFFYAQLPRAAITILVGAMLALVGSLMQQLTQNSLT